jgi:hypothetical protein
MTTADQLSIVERKLDVKPESGIKATVLAEGGLVQGWMKSRRLLVVLQQRSGSSAIFVFVSNSFPVAKPEDLTLETVLRVDSDFR